MQGEWKGISKPEWEDKTFIRNAPYTIIEEKLHKECPFITADSASFPSQLKKSVIEVQPCPPIVEKTMKRCLLEELKVRKQQ